MKSYVSPKVKITKSKNGKGLFAFEKIKSGEIVVDFSTGPGKYLKTKDADKFYEKGEDYMIQVDDGLFFAATNKKELEDADFINHSCDPNCGIKDKLKIVAMRDIKPGEEITFDYAMCESSEYKMKCNCGSPNCRREISGNDWKLKKLQKKYTIFFSDYLKRKIMG
ncbi:MAG: SET domain-containing protein-lysine N-methyltransferase [Nanoarchaeota archaeon]